MLVIRGNNLLTFTTLDKGSSKMKNIITLLTIILTINVFSQDWKTSATELIKQFETFRPSPYRDVNKLAIGWGFNDKNLVARGHMTKKEADRILEGYVISIGGYIDAQVKVPLTDNQKAALVVFVYNVGSGNFASSTLLKKLNNREYGAVPSEMKRWNKVKRVVNGKVAKDKNGKIIYDIAGGLVKRRAAESALWLKQ